MAVAFSRRKTQPRIAAYRGAVYWSRMAFAAVVSLLAATKHTMQPAYVTAPATCAKDHVNRGRRITARMRRPPIRLRVPAMANGFQSTILMRRPPVLQRSAHAVRARSALPLWFPVVGARAVMCPPRMPIQRGNCKAPRSSCARAEDGLLWKK